jgi:hypothetical protein
VAHPLQLCHCRRKWNGGDAGLYFSVAFTLQRTLISELSYLALAQFLLSPTTNGFSMLLLASSCLRPERLSCDARHALNVAVHKNDASELWFYAGDSGASDCCYVKRFAIMRGRTTGCEDSDPRSNKRISRYRSLACIAAKCDIC